MKRLVTLAACGALVVIGARLVRAQSDAPYTEGPVWAITMVKTKPGMSDDYLKTLAKIYKATNDEMKKQGLIMDYKVLLGNDANPQDFDIILIDTPPAMRAATVNALVVADSVIIPIDSSSFALLGMNQLLKTIAAISETHNPALKILVLTTMFNKRLNLDKIIRQQVEDFFGPSLVLESIIHRYVGVAEATAMRKGVVESSTTSSATFDFMKLFNELKREMRHEQERQGTVESIHR